MCSAEIFPKRIRGPYYLELKGVRLPCIWEDEFKWDIHIEAGDCLEFATGYFWFKDKELTKRACEVSDGFSFVIEVESSEGKEKLLEERYKREELSELSEGGWKFHRIVLGNCAGKDVTFRFKIEHLGSSTGDYGFWGNSVILNSQGGSPYLTPIFLVSIDTLRPQELVSYGYNKPTSFHLDKFGEDAVIFHRAYTPRTFTPVAHMSLLTGLEPESHGLIVRDTPARAGIHQISGILKDVGYITGGFVGYAWWFMPFMGVGRDFDYYSLPIEEGYRNAFEVLEEALEWLKEKVDQPVFVFVHVYDLHAKMQRGVQIYDSNDDRFRFFSGLMEVPEE